LGIGREANNHTAQKILLRDLNRRPRPTQGCRADDDDDTSNKIKVDPVTDLDSIIRLFAVHPSVRRFCKSPIIFPVQESNPSTVILTSNKRLLAWKLFVF
jgi:hypothetical protein